MGRERQILESRQGGKSARTSQKWDSRLTPTRFFDVNEGRGWRTNSGKPVDDWKKLAAVWDRNEHPKAATPLARTEPKADAVGKIPSVEEVMAKWGCDRETAQGYIDENMY